MPIIWFIVWLIILYNLYLMFFVYLPVIVGCAIIIVVLTISRVSVWAYKKYHNITWEDERYGPEMEALYKDIHLSQIEKLELYSEAKSAGYLGREWAKSKLISLRGEKAAS